jgi:hypothetical protein
MRRSPWLLAADALAVVVVVLLLLDPTRDFWLVLCLLALAVGLLAVGAWRGSRGGSAWGKSGTPGPASRAGRSGASEPPPSAPKVYPLPKSAAGSALPNKPRGTW